jgi:choline dehydrogenase-like flavoprotein
VNGGMAWRTPDKILQKWEWENGLTHMSPQDMDPYFSYVEDKANIRKQDPESLGRHSHLFAEGARKLNWHLLENTRNQKHCAGSNVCVLGCPTGAKQSTLQTFIPVAMQNGARLYANCRAEKILTKGNRAIGVTGHFVDQLGRKSHRMTVRAPIVVVAGGASETPALLMRSGIKSRSGLLGQNLQAHPNCKVIGMFDENVSCWRGTHQAHQVREFIDEGVLLASGGISPGFVALGSPEYGRDAADLMEHYNNMLVTGCLVEDTSRGYVKNGPGGAAMMYYDINDHDVYMLKRGASLLSKLLFEAGAKKVLLPFAHLPSLSSATEIKKIFDYPIQKTDIEILTVHIMGTAQMGGDPNKSVTNNWGEMHDVDSLFVSDASLFPSPIGVNPQETIMAIAVRNAAYILNKGKYLPGR